MSDGEGEGEAVEEGGRRAVHQRHHAPQTATTQQPLLIQVVHDLLARCERGVRGVLLAEESVELDEETERHHRSLSLEAAMETCRRRHGQIQLV